MYLYPLLSEYKNIVELTGISNTNYLFSLTTNFYTNQTSEKRNNNENIDKIENTKKWFFDKKQNNSYKHRKIDENLNEYEKKYVNKIKNFNLEDVALNQFLEFAIGDVIEDILEKNMIGHDNVTKVKVIKTNEYDDVMC